MQIAIADYLEINPETNRGRRKRWTTYTAVDEADARRQHRERIDAGEIPAGERDGGWRIVR